MNRLLQTYHNAIYLPSSSQHQATFEASIVRCGRDTAASLFRYSFFQNERQQQVMTGIAALVVMYEGPDERQITKLLKSTNTLTVPLILMGLGEFKEHISRDEWQGLALPILEERNERLYPTDLLMELSDQEDRCPALANAIGRISIFGLKSGLSPEEDFGLILRP